jgi:hypothetical protein
MDFRSHQAPVDTDPGLPLKLAKALSLAQIGLERQVRASASTDGNGLSVVEWSTLIEALASAVRATARSSLEPRRDTLDSMPGDFSSLWDDKYRSSLPSYSWAGCSGWDMPGALTSPFLPIPVVPECTDTSSKTNHISKLPSETLIRILKLARHLMDLADPEPRHSHSSSASPSRPSQMKWILSMALVCKEWKTAVYSAAYSSTVIRSRQQLVNLGGVMDLNPALVSYISSTDIRVPTYVPGAPTTPTAGHSYSRHGRHRTRAFPWLRSPAEPSSPDRTLDAPDEQMLCSLISRCHQLARLEVHITKASHYQYGGWPVGVSGFLERGCEHFPMANHC